MRSLPSPTAAPTGGPSSTPASPAVRRLGDWVSFAEARERLHGVRVLVLDPDTEAAGKIFVSLGQVGANVRIARRAVQVQPLLLELQPELVIVGTNLPDGDAVALCAALTADTSDRRPQVVALSARNTRSERKRFVAAGCAGLVSKPIDVRLFAQELARELGPRD